MANAYSLLHNYDQPLFQPNIGLIANVLEYKQNKLDTTRQKLQGAVDQFENLDMIRDVDKEYANKRLQGVLDIANKYTGQDVSDANISTALQSQVEQFMDDNVLSAVASTRLIRAEDAEWEQQRVKNPEKYADLNRAYAAQARQPYLQSQEVGAEYRGGGGFIEYTDINKLIQSHIMDIQKANSWEYVVTGAQEGYFRSLETKKVIDRGQMESAIEALIGEKEKNQLRINAWGAYSQVPDEDLRQEYSQHFNEKLKEIDGTIQVLEQIKASKTNPEDIAKIQESIDANQKDKDSYTATQNFDSVLKNGGRTSINNLLYTENLKDKFLNAYSREPYTIKREVDQVDKENRMYELALEKNAREERDIALKEQRFAFDIEQALKKEETESTSKKEGNKEGWGIAPITKDLAEMPNNPEAALKNYNTDRKKSMNDVAAIFGIDPKNSAKMLELQQLLSTDISEKSVLKFNGKTIDLNSPMSIEKNRAAKILKFQMYMKGTDPITKSLEKGVMEEAFSVYDDLTKLFVGGSFDGNSLRNFGFKLVKSGDKFKVVDMGVKEAKQYQIYLMRKEGKLTEEELATKKAYALAHPLMDSALNDQPEYKTLLLNTFNKYLMDTVTKSDLDKVIIPSNHNYARDYGTDVVDINFRGLTKEEAVIKDKALADIGKLTYLIKAEKSNGVQQVSVSETVRDKVVAYAETAVKREKAIKSGDTSKADGYLQYMTRLKSEIKQIKRYNPAFKYTGEDEISDFSAGYSYVTVDNPNGKFTSLVDGRVAGIGVDMGETLDVGSFTTRMTDGIRNKVVSINNELEGRYKDLQLTVQTFTKDVHKDLFNVIAAKVDQVSPIKISFERELDESGKFTGMFKYTSTNSKGESVEGKLNQSVLKTDSIPLNYGKIERNVYDASYGDDAPIINLGRNVFDQSQLSHSEQLHVESLKELYQNMVAAYPQHAGELNRAYSDYENGNLYFSMEANGVTYDYVMRSKNGQELYRAASEFTEMTDTDLQNAITKAVDLRDGIFLEYMTNIKSQSIYRANSVTPKQANRNFTGQ